MSQGERERRAPFTDPIAIPAISGAREASRREDQAADDGEAVVVPPHVLLARRRAAASSSACACTGQGRALKGRELRRLRDSVLRMTGFIES